MTEPSHSKMPIYPSFYIVCQLNCYGGNNMLLHEISSCCCWCLFCAALIWVVCTRIKLNWRKTWFYDAKDTIWLVHLGFMCFLIMLVKYFGITFMHPQISTHGIRNKKWTNNLPMMALSFSYWKNRLIPVTIAFLKYHSMRSWKRPRITQNQK